MVKLILIRHAQSEWNANNKISEEKAVNSKLTRKGIKQSTALDYITDLLILSPLKRCLETYTNSKIKVREITMNPVFREQMDILANRLELENSESETKEEFIRRVKVSIKYLKSIKSEYKSITIITHYKYLQTFTRLVLGEKHSFDNCGVLEIDF